MDNHLCFSPTEDCHARRLPPPDPCRTMPDSRPVVQGVFEPGDGPRSRTGSCDDLARDLAPPWATRRPSPAADGKATARRQAASAVPRKRTPERWTAVEDRRRAGGSPEPIAGRYRQPGEVMAGKEWIYQQVRADRQAGGTRYRCRRRRGKKPNGRGGRHAGRGHIPDRVDLAERPSVVAEKSRIGDWEREPILGARHRGARVSAVDRSSKFTVLEWVEGKTAAAGHRGAHPASGADPGPGPHRHGRSRQGVREASGDRTEA